MNQNTHMEIYQLPSTPNHQFAFWVAEEIPCILILITAHSSHLASGTIPCILTLITAHSSHLPSGAIPCIYPYPNHCTFAFWVACLMWATPCTLVSVYQLHTLAVLFMFTSLTSGLPGHVPCTLDVNCLLGNLDTTPVLLTSLPSG